MPDRNNVVRRPARAPLRSRSRKRWAIVAGIAGLWLLFLVGSSSLIGGSALLVMVAAIVVVLVVALRSFGFGMDHPWVERIASRPWRDGRDVLHLALRHLSEVFIVTPNGSLLAPNAVELCMNPADVASLADLIDLSLVNASAAEAYAAEVAAHSARIARDIPIEVSVVSDPAVPIGRYRLRQRTPIGAVEPAREVHAPAQFHDGRTQADPASVQTIRTGWTTVAESAPNPLLRLVTRDSVAETRVSGARAGRGSAVELTAARGTHRVPFACQVHLHRGRMADHQPGPQRHRAERDATDRRARDPRRGFHPVGAAARCSGVKSPDSVTAAWEGTPCSALSWL